MSPNKTFSFFGKRPKKFSHTYFCKKITVVVLVSHYKQSLFKQRLGRVLTFSTIYEDGDQIFHRSKMQHGFLNTQELQTLTCFILCPSQPVTSRCCPCALSLRSCEACRSPQAFLESLVKQQWQHVSDPGLRYPLGGQEGGFWPLLAVQIQ